MQDNWNNLKYYFLYHPGRTNKLIIINVAVFVLEGIFGVLFFLTAQPNYAEAFIDSHLTAPSYLPELASKAWTPLTYMFLHSGFFHILFNMLWLNWMGKIFEEYLGNYKILWVYLLGGLSGFLLYALSYNIFPVFASVAGTSHIIGASAAVMAVVAATATLLPNYTIRLLFLGNIPLKYIAIAYFALDFIAIQSSNAGGHIAHLGGAIFGFCFIKLLQSGYDLAEQCESIVRGINRMFSSKPKLKKTHSAPKYAAKVSKVEKNIDQEEIDRILDKIRLSGYDSLNAQEKETLFKASK
jgi:membrane associated rhomboid family serine protease